MLKKASKFIADKQEGELRVTISGRQAMLDKALLVLQIILLVLFASCFVSAWIISFAPAELVTFPFWLSAIYIGVLLLSIVESTLQVVWDATGQETIELREGKLRLQRRMLGVTASKDYDLEAIEGFRHISRPKTWLGFNYVAKILKGLPLGPHKPVAFSYNGKTIRIGTGIGEEDTRHLLALIKKYRRRG